MSLHNKSISKMLGHHASKHHITPSSNQASNTSNDMSAQLQQNTSTEQSNIHQRTPTLYTSSSIKKHIISNNTTTHNNIDTMRPPPSSTRVPPSSTQVPPPSTGVPPPSAISVDVNNRRTTHISTVDVDAPILYNNESCPPSFVIHKIIEYLQTQKRMVSVTEVESYLKEVGFCGARILQSKDILKGVENSSRVLYDVGRQKLAFVSPYENVVNSEALLAAITYDGSLTGLRVTDDLLNAHESMLQWIHDLLGARRIRCVRPNNSHIRGKLKCRFAATDKVCGLYSTMKCQECYDNVKELILYPLGEGDVEAAQHRLDPDVKALWDSMVLPEMEDILKDCNVAIPIRRYDTKPTRPEKRGKNTGNGRFFTKMRKIQNTHLFTPEELRKEIKEQQQAR